MSTPGQLSLLWEGGPAWFCFHDLERTLESLRLSYPGEVDGYRRYVAAALPRCAAALRAGARSRMSTEAVLRSFFREDALVTPGGVVGPVLWGLAPSTPGAGLGAVGYAVRHLVRVGRPVGGSGALPAALCLRRSRLPWRQPVGRSVPRRAPRQAILADRFPVRGVRLEGREELEARAVVVACDPRRAFVEWLREPPTGARTLVERWRVRTPGEGYQSKVAAVVAELPRYHALSDGQAERLGVADPLLPTAIVAPGGSGLSEAAAAMRAGHVARRPPAMVNVPSVADPAMRAPGRQHVLSLEVLFTPYALDGGWAGSAEPERWLGALGSLAQETFLEGVGARRAVTPVEWESEFSMERGHALAFGRSPLALLAGRDPELTRYERPVSGLFLTGAATFPGAGVWGASGRNAASVVLRRL